MTTTQANWTFALIIVVLLVSLGLVQLNRLVENLESVPEPELVPASGQVEAAPVLVKVDDNRAPGVWSTFEIPADHPPVRPFKASHYWPDAPPKPGAPYPGWPNCGSPLVNGHCQSRMGGSGLEWDEYVRAAVACPMTDNYPTWTIVVITEPASIRGRYVCLDHGGAIVEEPDGDWLDFLWPLETWPLQHGETVWGYVERP